MKKLYWNDGHSKTDPGAVGYVVERKVAVKVGDYAIAHLKANYTVDIKRSTGDVGSLTYICNEANKFGADLFVSVHLNSAAKKEVGDGYEAWLYSKKNIELGQIFEKHVKSVGQNSRGIKYSTELGVLRLTNMPAILNEIAFVNTWKDIKDWDEPHELKKMGIALAEACAEYLDLPKKTVKYKTVVNNLNHRKKARLVSTIMQKIPKDTVLNVHSIDKNGWGKVVYKNKTGYVRIKSRTKTYCVKVK